MFRTLRNGIAMLAILIFSAVTGWAQSIEANDSDHIIYEGESILFTFQCHVDFNNLGYWADYGDYGIDNGSSATYSTPNDLPPGTYSVSMFADVDDGDGGFYAWSHEVFFIVLEAPCFGTPSGGTASIFSGSATAEPGADIAIEALSYTDEGAGLERNWQSSADGAVWADIPGATGDTYYANDLTESIMFRYRVTCTASDETGYSNEIGITVESLCDGAPTAGTAAQTGGTPSFCSSGDITIDASGYTADDGIMLQWQRSTDEGFSWNDISGETNASYAATGVSESARYRLAVTCAASAMTDYSNEVATTVIESVTPMVNVDAPEVICYKQGVANFVASGMDLGSAPSYQWYRNAVEIDGATEAEYSTGDIGKSDEVISVIVSNIDAVCATATEVSGEATVHAFPTPDPNTTYVTASTSTKLCEGDPVTFTSKSASLPGATFSWSRDGVFITDESGSSYTTSEPGAITATVTAEEGCTRTSAARVINPMPTATISENSADGGGSGTAPVGGSFCTGGFTTLYANTDASVATYRWKLNGANKGAAVTQKVTAGGDYTVTVTKNGCAATSMNFPVTEKTTDVTVTPSGDLTFCTPGSVRLDAVIDGEYMYQWYRSAAAIASETNASYTATTSGSYSVRITNGSCPERKSAVSKAVAIATPVATVVRASKQPLYWKLRANPGTTGYTFQWYKDDSPLDGATNREYDASVNGLYAVTVSNGSCESIISAAYNVNATTFPPPPMRSTIALNETLINIFPNPSTGVFYIGSQEAVNVVVKDLQGRMITEVKNAASIDLGNQPVGMYIMSITDAVGKLLQVERVVKQ
jgi:hypothetical protein